MQTTAQASRSICFPLQQQYVQVHAPSHTTEHSLDLPADMCSQRLFTIRGDSRCDISRGMCWSQSEKYILVRFTGIMLITGIMMALHLWLCSVRPVHIQVGVSSVATQYVLAVTLLAAV
jgi:hypothetical protein